MRKIIILLFAISFIFQSCGNREDTKQMNESKNEGANLIKKTQAGLTEKTKKYSLEIEPTDSVQFQLKKAKVNYKQDQIKKITDFETAKKMLKGVVFFNDNDEDGETQAILRIRFRNGKENIYTDDTEHFYFVAYYPTEDILLSEGGHTTDISFNLKNGEEIEVTGNPDYIVTSPNKLFRVNGHYNGQQCSSYFIQQGTKNQFEKIIQLDTEFQKQTKIWLCVVGDVFWQNDTTFYLTEESDYTDSGLIIRYYKIKLIER